MIGNDNAVEFWFSQFPERLNSVDVTPVVEGLCGPWHELVHIAKAYLEDLSLGCELADHLD